jgi:hypothetical protein
VRLLRTWPRRIPEGRNYVIDDVERLVVHQYDARALATVGDDVLVIEWDIAVSREDLALFADTARATPGRVLVAPYRLYPPAYGLREPIWSPRTMPGNVPVQPGDQVCHYFGFGMTYLPQALLERFAGTWLRQNPAGNLTDETFSGWHYRTVAERDVPVCWNVRPVHLHYPAAGVIGA